MRVWGLIGLEGNKNLGAVLGRELGKFFLTARLGLGCTNVHDKVKVNLSKFYLEHLSSSMFTSMKGNEMK